MPRCAVPPLGPVRGGDPDPLLSLQSWGSAGESLFFTVVYCSAAGLELGLEERHA
jgi:hypothetical protein